MDNKELKDNFYKAINKEWIKKTKIPADKSSTGAFLEIHLKLEKKLQSIANSWSKNTDLIPDDQKLKEFIKFYNMTKDFEKRNNLGFSPILKLIQKIESFSSFKDLEENYKEYSAIFPFLPLNFYVYSDFLNPDEQILHLDEIQLILPEKSFYEDVDKKKKLLKIYAKSAMKLLLKINKNPAEAKLLIKNALKFDELLIESKKSGTELANYIDSYNPTEISKVIKSSKSLDIKLITQNLVGTDVKMINVTNLRFLNSINKIVNKKNFEKFRALLIIKTLFFYSNYLSEEARLIAGEFDRKISGIKKATKKEKSAYKIALSVFNMPFGLYYGKKYFGESSKKKVEKMVKNMISIYKERLTKNSWLSRETIKKAIIKLNALDVMVGYPIELQEYFDKISIKTYDQGGNLFSNIVDIKKIQNDWQMSQYGKPVNKNFWSMSPAVVNAYFNPTKNHIVFPAGILAEPFYSKKQSLSQNYGGIGAVIAHEISHAFDNNGANFNEKGVLFDWWTSEDKKNFENKAKEMINLFDGVETEYGKCNGKLTVSENIADAGGLSCAFAAAKLEKDFNPREFFEAWAKIWRSKYTEEQAKIFLATDPHAPTLLRANLQLKNFEEFQKEYDIKEEDGMYLEPSKMVKIW